jgi:hypothetical protein
MARVVEEERDPTRLLSFVSSVEPILQTKKEKRDAAIADAERLKVQMENKKGLSRTLEDEILELDAKRQREYFLDMIEKDFASAHDKVKKWFNCLSLIVEKLVCSNKYMLLLFLVPTTSLWEKPITM